MRKLLSLTILSVMPALGCEMARRVEVWKAQNFFTPQQPVVVTPGPAQGLVPASAAPACNCQQSAAMSAAATAPVTMGAGYPEMSEQPTSTEELDGVLKQP